MWVISGWVIYVVNTCVGAVREGIGRVGDICPGGGGGGGGVS